MTDRHKKLIQSSFKSMKCASVVKFHHMLAYQIELGYDLALAPDMNVSGNPGFEAVLGVICTIE